MPKLSVVLPCYNVARTVDITLKSLLAQPIDLEVIAVEDCSKDSTKEVLLDWQARDPRVQVVLNEANVGLASARNVGFAHARGEHTAFVDSDDWVSKDFHPSLVSVIEREGLDFVRCDHVRVTMAARALVRAPEVVRHETIAPRDSVLPIHSNSMVDYPYAWAGAFRTSFLRERGVTFPDGVRTAEDRPWIWRVHCEGARYQLISQAGYFYRQESPEALTRVGDVRQLEFFRSMDMAIAYLEETDAPPLFLAKAYRQLLSILASQYQRRERLEGSVRSELMRRARVCTRGFDERILAHAVDGLDEGRASLLSQLTGRRISVSA